MSNSGANVTLQTITDKLEVASWLGSNSSFENIPPATYKLIIKSSSTFEEEITVKLGGVYVILYNEVYIYKLIAIRRRYLNILTYSSEKEAWYN